MPLPRRTFLQTAGVLAGGLCLGARHVTPPGSPEYTGQVMTVTGPVAPEELGFCLPHEHLLSRFGTDPAEPSAYDAAAALDTVVPYLQYLRELGVGAVADCTAYSFGRAPELLRRISAASGVRVLTNTGWYAAADDRYVPAEAYSLAAADIARRWTGEFSDGIGDSGIRPGFIKIAVDAGPLSPIDAKLVRAAALTHRATGLTIKAHTGDNATAARQQLEILAEEGIAPGAWTWTHAQNMTDSRPLIEAANRGAWISLDGVKTRYFADGATHGNDTLDRHLAHLMELREAGLLHCVIVSHDGSTFPPAGTVRRPMDILSNTFLPLIRARGFSADEISTLTVTNPARYFTIRRRLLE
ncbi:phosphotriesterase [Lewinella sp. JB7]|uniref:phosphotriesterase family protein n=1 Tax=Lewinella sp. JB7 TaxID=2962887 RepID=UPI0020C978E0|nr:hypothetical protein [Lewinella sp. JB7]MCP9236090.1 hypothetical protein [Lewinella sp. JB7]